MSAPEVPSRPGDSAAKRVLLAAPRGYCAGVDRAVEAVEQALEQHGAPVYVRKQIVHNRHVVETLEDRGAIFVEDTAEVPEGALLVFSAHGVSPAVRAEARDRQLRTIDATCPLVTKVHQEAKRFARDDFDILLVGHAGHEEVEGTSGEAPSHIQLVETAADVDAVSVRDPRKIVSPPAAKWRASACTLLTSGQVASITSSRRAWAVLRTAGETPCAEKTTVAPSGTPSSSSTKTAPRRSRSATTCSLCTICLRT